MARLRYLRLRHLRLRHSLLTDHNFTVGIMQMFMVYTESLLFHLLQKGDHEEAVREDGAVFVLLQQVTGKFRRPLPGFCTCFRLAPHVCEPLDSADSGPQKHGEF